MILIGRYYITSFLKLAILLLVPLIARCTRLFTITVPPILFNPVLVYSSRTFIEDTSKSQYIYMAGYYTSVYITWTLHLAHPSFVDTTDDSI